MQIFGTNFLKIVQLIIELWKLVRWDKSFIDANIWWGKNGRYTTGISGRRQIKGILKIIWRIMQILFKILCRQETCV